VAVILPAVLGGAQEKLLLSPVDKIVPEDLANALWRVVRIIPPKKGPSGTDLLQPRRLGIPLDPPPLLSAHCNYPSFTSLSVTYCATALAASLLRAVQRLLDRPLPLFAARHIRLHLAVQRGAGRISARQSDSLHVPGFHAYERTSRPEPRHGIRPQHLAC
jgi:hypothetical protein